MRRMVRGRLLAAEAAAAVIIFLVVLSTDPASNGGSLSASMVPEVFCAKNSSYGTELHARDSYGGPGTAHAAEDLIKNCRKLVGGKLGKSCRSYNEKLLKIGVPQKDGFKAFVNVSHPYFFCMDNATRPSTTKQVTRYSIDVFEAAMKKLQHPPCYDFCIFDGSYDEPVGNVSLGILQGASGDVTITANRIGKVDFTMPYTQSGVSLLELCESDLEPIQWTFLATPTKELWFATVGCFFFTGFVVWLLLRQFSNTFYFAFSTLTFSHAEPPIQWVFLKPLTKELWLATVCFIFFTAFAFWMIERSINNPLFKGSSLAQFSTALNFVFSTLTFSHGQILRSPLSKIVLAVWCFAVLVLVQSYLATLSSMLAAEASTTNGSSAAGPVALTLRSFSGLFVVTGCILAFMLIISFTTRWVYATSTRVIGSESRNAYVDGGSVRLEEFSTPQNDSENGSVVPEQPVQEVTDNDSQGGHVSSAICRDEDAGGAMQDIMSNASEPAPDVYVQIEMTSTSNGAGVVGVL